MLLSAFNACADVKILVGFCYKKVKGLMMAKQQKTAQQIRFEKEAKALQKNIAKRKKQQEELEKLKQKKGRVSWIK